MFFWNNVFRKITDALSRTSNSKRFSDNRNGWGSWSRYFPRTFFHLNLDLTPLLWGYGGRYYRRSIFQRSDRYIDNEGGFFEPVFNFMSQVLKIIGYVLAAGLLLLVTVGCLAALETLLMAVIAELGNIMAAAAMILISYPITQYVAYLFLPPQTFQELKSSLEPIDNFLLTCLQPIKSIGQNIWSLGANSVNQLRLAAAGRPQRAADVAGSELGARSQAGLIQREYELPGNHYEL
ncbi:MAG TPA: hypothetical protein QF353_03765 [Gammaproteobacteria bacterium]|nr:hypothetical protein [Gammaproteobacteria bacterium]